MPAPYDTVFNDKERRMSVKKVSVKNRDLSHHIWRAIEAQAKTVADSLTRDKSASLRDDDIAAVDEFELKRLRLLIRQLEEDSP